jgi:UDP-N-acetylglucosamine:LPS N-acetylglucosamine transferase
MPTGSYDYDLAILGDFRYPGGTSVSLAEELKAQTAAGYTTALVPMRTPQLKRKRRFHAQLINCIQSGMGELVAPDQALRVKLLVIRHPGLLTEDPDPRPRVEADQVLMVANQTPGDLLEPDGILYYDPARVDRRLHELFGDQVLWTPIGPEVREGLNATGAALNLSPTDWHNVLDPDEWWADRSSYVAERPVIGRHSRPHWKKWPASAEQILAAYPDDEAIQVKILGGGEVAADILGRVPSNWTLYPFNSVPPRDFLREIDFQVYYHHPQLIEAFGRTIVEALASATPTIVSPHFEKLFGDACVYAEPEDVAESVWRLYDDPAGYRERAEQGHLFVRENFGHEVHRRRIAEFVGKPAEGSPRRAAIPRRRAQDRAILFAANGSGMGHLTRTMAVARRLPEAVQPIFVTLSSGMNLIRDAGYLCEYIPQGGGERWQAFLEQRLVEIIASYGPKALVFDSAPFTGLTEAKLTTGLPFVWIRRAMWQKDRGGSNLARAGHFDLVIEPGEFAADFDQGLTTAHREGVVCVPPILLLDEPELIQRDEARAELGLEDSNLTVLVQLGSGNIDELAFLLRTTVERLLRIPNLEVVVGDSPISRGRVELPSEVRRLTTYPINRYLKGFDFAISAAGYNSVHELVGFGMPTVFIPMRAPLDDQHGRARYVEAVGAGLSLDPISEAGLDRCLETILAEDRRRDMSERCQELFPGNGAPQAASAVADLVAHTSRLERLG